MITDDLYDTAARQGAKSFLVFEDREISYAQTAAMVSAMAVRLHETGVRPGDRVALFCGNRPAFLIAWFAISELGAIAVPLNVALKGEGLAYTLSQSGASLLLAEPDLIGERRADLEPLAQRCRLIAIDDAVEAPPAVDPGRWRRAVRPAGSAPNSILYTSGTTGLPKGAVLPHDSYAAAGRDMARSLGLTSEDRIMVFLPLFHANPQMYAVTSALRVGATLVLLPKFSASRFFDDAICHRATGFTYVGTVLSILEKHHPEPRRDHGLRWGVGGGAPERVWRVVEERFGVALRELYGMTETGGWVTMNVGGATRIGSVGRPREGVEVSVRDEAGQPLPAGEKGEIVVRAPGGDLFFSEYWNNRDATAATLRSGWLHTGDRGAMDADGYLYFHGRIKELIRRGGEMIAPAEIEQQLLKHPDVRDCVVIGVPDEIMGEEVRALVVGRGAAPEVLRDFLAERLPGYMVPRYYSFVEAIPKTETEKVKRHELAAIDAATADLGVQGGGRTETHGRRA